MLGIYKKIAIAFTLFVFTLLFAGCETTDGTLRDQGHSESYVIGFHDGRHSGMKEAGNTWEHYIKDHEKFTNDGQYTAGWIAGEAEGQRIQTQAQAVGEAAAAGYSGYQINEETKKAKPNPDDIAKDVMKNVDTKELKALEK